MNDMNFSVGFQSKIEAGFYRLFEHKISGEHKPSIRIQKQVKAYGKP